MSSTANSGWIPPDTTITGATLNIHTTTGASVYTSQTYVPNQLYPPVQTQEMILERNATDFVLWLNGALDVLDATPPSQAQWDTMRNKIAEQMGQIVAHRIRKAAAEQYPTSDANTYYAAQQAQIHQQQIQAYQTNAALQAYKAKVDQLAASTMSAAQLASSTLLADDSV